MSLPPVSFLPFDGSSVCLFCGASETADPSYTEAAYAFGKATAEAGWRLVYGGGGVGLMGASARGAHDAGGRVVGSHGEQGRSDPADQFGRGGGQGGHGHSG